MHNLLDYLLCLHNSIDGVVISDVVEVIESSDLRSMADVDSMDPSLVSLK